MKLRGLIPNFHHIHVSERFIYSHDLSTYFALQQTRFTNRYSSFAVQVPGSTLDPASEDSYSEELQKDDTQQTATKLRQIIKPTAWPLI
jgi:hypothetical protein